MPKTAINYYNLRKGLYLKNGRKGKSMHSRDITRASNTHDHCVTQSMGILNAYGELANDVSLD